MGLRFVELRRVLGFLSRPRPKGHSAHSFALPGFHELFLNTFNALTLTPSLFWWVGILRRRFSKIGLMSHLTQNATQ